jgi:peptidoglycan/xylan/chitin deacetylase (PgdA/CDA1 family)
VLLIAGGDARRVVLLAEQIERHVPDARICGIIYKIPSLSPVSIASHIKNWLRSFGGSIGRLVLRLIHGGGPWQPEMSESARDQLSRECDSAGWDLCLVQDIDTPKFLGFATQKKADLSVAFGLSTLPGLFEGIANRGTIQGQILSVDRQGSETVLVDHFKTNGNTIEIRVRIHQSVAGRKDLPLTRVKLFRQALDTAVSLELKSNLILRDLLVQSVAALAQHPELEAVQQVNSWIRNMLPFCLHEPDASACNGSVDEAPPLRVRSRWQLSVYSLFLLLPPVLLRNWLRRRKKQHPVVFLTSHLISDRHHRMTLPTEAFLRQVQFLQRYYRIVSLSEAIKLLKSGTVREPTVVLTFDDGYEDNFFTLRAVSEETGIPVVMFISTEPVKEHREFTHDFERGLKGFRALTWDQIRYWGADGTEFQSHTCSHFDCGSVDQAALEKEMAESKRELETQLGKRVTSLAFPFGKPKNMSSLAMTIAGKTYDHFLSSYGGENFPSESRSHQYLLRRHLLGNAWESELQLQGVFETVESLKRFIHLGPKSANENRIQAERSSNAREPQAVGD